MIFKFRGGAKVAHNKKQTAGKPIETLPMPRRLYVHAHQHMGAPAKPVVGAGDAVSVGDLIAEIPQDALGANIHASIAGRVSRVDEATIEIVA